jgi:Tol biopolymer transport system component
VRCSDAHSDLKLRTRQRLARILYNGVHAGSYRGEPGPAAAVVGWVDVGSSDDDSGDEGAVDFAAFEVPGQVNWQPAQPCADGRRFVVLSMEAGICHLDTTRTNLWLYDMQGQRLEPLLEHHRPVPYATFVAWLPGEERMITAHARDGRNTHVISAPDGRDAHEIPLPDDGFSYCLQPSPDGERVVFHTASRRGGYRISVMAWDGSGLVEIAGDAAHLFFGPTWSPEGDWLLFADCEHGGDPEHMRSELCVVRPDGSDFRRLTDDRSHWLSPVFGDPQTKGSGSEIPKWMPDGERVTWVRLKPGSVTPWPLAQNPEVDDHFNRDFRPQEARGGTDLWLRDVTGVGGGDGARQLTHNDDGIWDFRATPSPDGAHLAFCRSRTGEPSQLWLLEVASGEARFLTSGVAGTGVDHPKWMGCQ